MRGLPYISVMDVVRTFAARQHHADSNDDQGHQAECRGQASHRDEMMVSLKVPARHSRDAEHLGYDLLTLTSHICAKTINVHSMIST